MMYSGVLDVLARTMVLADAEDIFLSLILKHWVWLSDRQGVCCLWADITFLRGFICKKEAPAEFGSGSLFLVLLLQDTRLF